MPVLFLEMEPLFERSLLCIYIQIVYVIQIDICSHGMLFPRVFVCLYIFSHSGMSSYQPFALMCRIQWWSVMLPCTQCKQLTHRYITHSNHTKQQKLSAFSFRSTIHRLNRTSQAQRNYQNESSTIKYLAEANEYVRTIINKLIHKTEKQTTDKETENNNKFIT